MNLESQSNIQHQSETVSSNISSKKKAPIPTVPNYEPKFHYSQVKGPIVHLDGKSPDILDFNNSQDIKQSYNPKGNNTSKIKLNILNLNKSIQQEKYDFIKKFCFKKK